MGPQMWGPNPKPACCSDCPRVPTSGPTPNSSDSGTMVGLYTELAKVAPIVVMPYSSVVIIFLRSGQFIGR